MFVMTWKEKRKVKDTCTFNLKLTVNNVKPKKSDIRSR